MYFLKLFFQTRRNNKDCISDFKNFLGCASRSTISRKKFSWVAPEGEYVDWQRVQKKMARMLSESGLNATHVKFEWNVETIGVGDAAPKKISVAVSIS